jgi:hypothetical protein
MPLIFAVATAADGLSNGILLALRASERGPAVVPRSDPDHETASAGRPLVPYPVGRQVDVVGAKNLHTLFSKKL